MEIDFKGKFKMKKFIPVILFSLLPGLAMAAPPSQQVQKPTVAWDGITPHSGTSSAGSTIISKAPTVQVGPRYDCVFINTSQDMEYLDFGVAATVGSIPVAPGNIWFCSGLNSINQDSINMFSGQSGDSYYLLVTVLQQF